MNARDWRSLPLEANTASRWRVGTCFLAFLLWFGLVVGCSAQERHPDGAATQPALDPVQVEVLGNLRRQAVGNHTLDDFNLPSEFLRRVTDRIIRNSFEDRFRMVVRDGAGADTQPSHAAQNAPDAVDHPPPPAPPPPPDDRIRIADRTMTPEALAYWKSLPETRPPLRGYRAPILKEAADLWPFDPPNSEAPTVMRQAAEVVAKRLAKDGLLDTTAQVIALIGPQKFVRGGEESVRTLRSVGLPVDLLGFFSLKDHPEVETITLIASELAKDNSPESLKRMLSAASFNFRQSHPGFHIATESGEDPISSVRLQLTRGGYWEGPGDGGNVDLTRQVIEQLPDVTFTASIQRTHISEFRNVARSWPLNLHAPLQLIPEELPVAQWAQDNGKPGFVADGTPAVATLVPRYASRGEDGSTFVPGETLLLDGLAAAGMSIIHSPLLFQGGNLLAVRDPSSGRRILLVGEAEIFRNTAMGLTRDQVVEAFRIECGVDRCIVLPSVSFHIDYDLCVRAQNGKLVAFVNDTSAAAGIILKCGVEAMRAHNMLDAPTSGTALEHLNAGRLREAVQLIGPIVFAQSDGDGHFPLAFAAMFSTGPRDSAVGNLQRFLLAIDTIVSQTYQRDELPADQYARSYYESLARREADRKALHQQLRDEGFEVIEVPSFADAARSIVYVNGIHDPTRYLMPTYGGLYKELDDAASAAFSASLDGQVRVIPLLCSESQRRVGAVHCSIAVYPRPPSGALMRN